mgnify:CR=1 FL=1
MKKIRSSMLVLSLILISSCASTKISSFKDPDYEGVHFQRILVAVNSSNLTLRQKLESEIVNEFIDISVYALESYKLFPPTREFSMEDRTALMIEKAIDAYIDVSVGESGVKSVYIPQTSSTTKTKGNVNVYGNSVNYKEKSTTTYQGGYDVEKPWAEFETRLFDVSNGRVAWIASSFTGGNAYANKNTVANAYCSAVVKKLVGDKLIRILYVGSKNSTRYHLPNCKWTKEITDRDLIEFESKKDANNHGYSPCTTCKP